MGSKILVVEDDRNVSELIEFALERSGFEVDVVHDGEEALESVSSCEYAVILLDLMMPRISGSEFLTRYKEACPDHRSILIVMSAFADETPRARIASAHAVVRKPFDVQQLTELVRAAAALFAESSATR